MKIAEAAATVVLAAGLGAAAAADEDAAAREVLDAWDAWLTMPVLEAAHEDARRAVARHDAAAAALEARTKSVGATAAHLTGGRVGPRQLSVILYGAGGIAANDPSRHGARAPGRRERPRRPADHQNAVEAHMRESLDRDLERGSVAAKDAAEMLQAARARQRTSGSLCLGPWDCDPTTGRPYDEVVEGWRAGRKVWRNIERNPQAFGLDFSRDELRRGRGGVRGLYCLLYEETATTCYPQGSEPNCDGERGWCEGSVDRSRKVVTTGRDADGAGGPPPPRHFTRWAMAFKLERYLAAGVATPCPKDAATNEGLKRFAPDVVEECTDPRGSSMTRYVALGRADDPAAHLRPRTIEPIDGHGKLQAAGLDPAFVSEIGNARLMLERSGGWVDDAGGEQRLREALAGLDPQDGGQRCLARIVQRCLAAPAPGGCRLTGGRRPLECQPGMLTRTDPRRMSAQDVAHQPRCVAVAMQEPDCQPAGE